MAGDWIKVQNNVHEKPEVITIGSRLMMNRYEVVGRLIKLWAWADAHTVDGHAEMMNPAVLDEIVQAKGFCEAMQSVQWLEINAAGITFPAFDRHNSKTAKLRSTAAERQARSREARQVEAMSQNVTGHVTGHSVIPRPLRRKIYERDGHACRYCGWSATESAPPAGMNVGLKRLSIDHVIPQSKGGETVEDNLVTACLACNKMKAGRTPAEAGMALVTDCDNPVTKPLPEKRREEYKRAPLSKAPPSGAPPAFPIPEDDGLHVTDTTRAELAKLEDKVRSLRPGWKLPLSHPEQRILLESMATLAALSDEDWTTVREYLHARLPQGSPGWQPEIRRKFLETVSDVWGHASEWKRKQQGRTAKPTPKPPPPEQTEEDRKALEEFLKPIRRSNAAN